jgi:DNA mismatch repair protein MutS2
VKVGDVVELASVPGSRVTVMEIDGDDVVVARGAVRTRTSLQNLRAPGEKKEPASKERTTKKKPAATSTTGPEPRTSDNSLDVRGQRADEAVELLEAFLDKLLRGGRSTGYVLHGHGGGALKKAVRGWLSGSRYVRAHGAGSVDDGGDGWTVVELDPDARL